jgi:uncharacterized protein YegP (UPF0339 family)
MQGIRFEVYLGSDRLYHWRLVAANNEIVGWGEGYSSQQAAIDAVDWVRRVNILTPIFKI